MHINNNLCPYKVRKDESKCSSKIFRPWDIQIAKNCLKDTAQDCTVSTTTRDEELGLKVEDSCLNSVDNERDKVKSDVLKMHFKKNISSNTHEDFSILSPPKSDFSSCENLLFNTADNYLHNTLHTKAAETCVQTNPLVVDYLQDPYTSITTDLVQSNLAHQLGLPPNDPLLLESIAQGYAMEEYARVVGQEQQAKLMASKKQRPKKYKCPHCEVGFSNNGQLKGHIRIHTGERPFKCDEKDCGKTFTRNEELTRHKRIHSGLRPYPCSHCGKRFGRKDHLKKHSRTHFQPRGLYAVPVVLPFEAWASGQTNGYPFFPVMY